MIHVERLSWAGVKLVSDRHSLVIDALGDASPLEPFLGRPQGELVPVGGSGSIDVALITHAHLDHYDAGTLRDVLGDDGLLVCPVGVAPDVDRTTTRVSSLEVWGERALEGLTVSAVPAVDGVGDEQVSWIVSAGGRRIIHCGDTLWHGYWDAIAARYGTFDVAFLPINAALIAPPSRSATGIPICLGPREAVAAAVALGAKWVVPIHYGLFHNPPLYASLERAAEQFAAEAERRGVGFQLLAPGEAVDWHASR